jgi:hypothetical protein
LLRRTFGHRREEVAGESRKVHSEELRNLYPSPLICDQIKKNDSGAHAHGCDKNAHVILVGKLERKRPLVKPRDRWGYFLNGS